MAEKVNVQLRGHNGETVAVSALADRSGNLLVRKAMRAFSDGGEIVGLRTAEGKNVSLDLTLAEIVAMSDDLQVVFEGEELTASTPPSTSSPASRAPTSPAATTATLYKAGANLRVRGDCDKGAEVIGDIPKADTFEVLEVRGDWFRIQIPGENKNGWILSRNKARSLVEPLPGDQQTPPQSPASPPQPKAPAKQEEEAPQTEKRSTAVAPAAKASPETSTPPSGDYFVAVARLNVRLEADGSSDAVTDIEKGSVVRVKGEKGDWVNVVVNGRDDLWVKSRNRVKSLLGPAPADAACIWQSQEDKKAKMMTGEYDEEEEKKKKWAEEQRKKEMNPATKSAVNETETSTSSVDMSGSYFTCRVRCNVRDGPSSSAEIIADMGKAQIVKALEANGDWIRIAYKDDDGAQLTAWMMRRNKVSEVLIPMENGAAAWEKQEQKRQHPEDDAESEDKMKQGKDLKQQKEEMTSSKGQDYDLPEPPPKRTDPTPAAEPAAPPQKPTLVPVGGAGGEFYVANVAIRLRDEPNSNGEVVGELNKGDAIKCIATQGDWLKVEYDDRVEVWLMQRNKRGKQMAEPAPDASSFAQKWKEQQKALKDAREALEKGDDLDAAASAAPATSGGFGGGGGFESAGSGKKQITDEEAELLAMLKGFGSNTFEEGGTGGAPEGGNVKTEAKPPPKLKEKLKSKPAVATAAPGVEFYLAKVLIRVRNEPNSSGEVLGELNKGDAIKCVAVQGDWLKVEYGSENNAWIMQQNKTGKKMAEPASDTENIAQKWMEQQMMLKALAEAAEAGEDPNNAPPPTPAGGGMKQIEGTPKKQISDEEAELLAMLKGFGSTTFANGGTDESNAVADAPPPKPKVQAKKPPKPKSPAKPKPSSTAADGAGNPSKDEEAELLAMLKGLSSGAAPPPEDDAGAAAGASNTTGVDDRPLVERLDDSDWKIRKLAYSDLTAKFESESDGTSETFGTLGRAAMEIIVQEKNANAYSSAVPAVELFMTKADDTFAADLAEALVDSLIRQGLKQPKPKPCEAARKAIVACLGSAAEPGTIIQQILGGLSIDHIKIPAECVRCLRECVKTYGPFALSLKVTAGKSIDFLGHSNKKVQEEGVKYLGELTKWLGALCLDFAINKLNEKDNASVLKKLEGINPAETTATRFLRHPIADSSPVQRDEAGNVIVDLVEPVDLSAELKKTEFSTLIASTKWNERVTAMNIIVKCCGSPPKIIPGDYSSLIDKLRESVHDKMVAVAIAAVQTLGVVGDGMGKDFKSHARSITKEFIERIKEKKLVEPACGAMLKFYSNAALTLGDTSSTIRGTIFPSAKKVVPPHAMIGVLGYTTKCVGVEKIKPKKDEIADATALGVDILQKVSDPKIKGAAVELMTALLGRERKEKPDKTGPVHAALQVLAEAKDSGAKMLYKKIAAGASPDTSTNQTDAAASSARKKSAKKEKGGTGEKKTANGESEKKKADDGSGSRTMDISIDDALEALQSLNHPQWKQILKDLDGSAWAEKKAAVEALGKADYAGKVHTLSPALVTILKDKTKNFGEKNANVMKGVFLSIASCAGQSTKESGFDKGAASAIIAVGCEKLADKKQASAVRDMLTALAESISPSFVMKGVVKGLDKLKALAVHQEGVPWFTSAIKDFGLKACGEGTVAAFAIHEHERGRTELKDVKTRSAVEELLCECYKQGGPPFVKKHLKKMSDQLQSITEKEFAKITFDPKIAATVKKAALADDDEEGADGGEERQDLNKLVPKDVLDKLGDPDNKKWKDRKASMDAIISGCEDSGNALNFTPFVKDALKALAKCLTDLQVNNKPLAAQAIGGVLNSLDPKDAPDALKACAKPLVTAVADGKKTMRDAAIEAIDKGCAFEQDTIPPLEGKNRGGKCEAKCLDLILKQLAAKESGLVKPVGREELLTWSLERFPHYKSGTDMKVILPQLVSCMNDKSATVRSLAEKLLSLMFSKKSCKMKDVEAAMEKLSSSAKRSTIATVQKIFESSPIESTSEKPSIQATERADNTDLKKSASVSSTPKLTSDVDQKSPRDKIERSSSLKTGHSSSSLSPKQPPPNLALLVNRGKDRREKESWKTKWPVPPSDEPPGEKEALKLRDEWSPCIVKEKLDVFFPATTGSMDCGDEALELIFEVVQHGDDIFIGHLDLLFKWFTLRLCERECTPTLLRLLDVISGIVENLIARGYELRDFEANIIIPHVLEQSGNAKERVAASMKRVMAALSQCYHLQYASLLIKSLKSKNSRTQAACLLEIARIIEGSGVEVIGVKGLKEVVKCVGSSDSAVRNAALDSIQESYLHVGAQLYEYLGLEPTSKSHAIIDARLKRAPPPHSAAAAASSTSSSGDRRGGRNNSSATSSVSVASFSDEILARLDVLLLASHPLDKQSNEYLEGKDVIKVVHSLASGSENADFAFNRASLVSNANAVISKLSACLNMSFICAEPQSELDVDVSRNGAGGMDVQLLSVCLAALMALFRLPELCHEVKAPPLRDMLACTCSRLLDDRLAATRGPYAATAAQVIKALNKISIQSAIQAPRDASLSALLFLLSNPITPLPQSSSKFSTKITTIFAKLFNRILTEEIENASGSPFGNIDLPVITYALNDFFTVHPKRQKGCETQYDAAAGLLKRLVLHLGSDRIVTVVSSTLPGGRGRPLLAAIQNEMPNERRALNIGALPQSEVNDLILRMQSSAGNPDEAMALLSKFRSENPGIDIRAHLNGISGVFKTFILSQLQKLEARDARGVDDGKASKQERLKQLKHKLRNTED